jgi:phosphohistidine phosphatase
MKLYFLRHADALDGADDAARPLSPAGKADARRIGRFLKHAGIQFDAAYTSPLVRARQTAEIVLATACPVSPVRLKLANALLNESDDFQAWLGHLPAARHVLLVGHAPSLAEQICRLLGVADPDRFRLPKAGLACVETENRGPVRLKFFIAPKVL